MFLGVVAVAVCCQVVNPYTGDAYAQAPPLPEPVKDMTWE